MRLVETGSFPIAEIEIGPRVRPLDEAHAQAFAAMFQQSPMQNPVVLVRLGNAHRLVAGRHRVRAYEINGWSDIPAHIYEPSTDQPMAELELAEIDENLGRRGLNVLDRAASIVQRQAVLKALYGETRGRPSTKTAKFAGISVSKEIAAKVNLSERTIYAATAMFNGLSAASRQRVSGTWLADNHIQLRDLSKLAAKAQSRALNLILGEEPKAKRVVDAVCIIEKRPKARNSDEKSYVKLQKAWLKAPRKVQRQFLEFLRMQGVAIGGAAD